jgi:CBS-domain-containing membrane protein
MANIDPDLQRLEEVIRVARERLTQVMQKVADAAAVKAATDICTEAIAAVRAYLAKRK